MTGWFSFLTESVCDGLWQMVILPFVLVSGLLFSIQTNFFHLTHFFSIIKDVVGRCREKKKVPGKVTPFQALCTALAGTVGTGSVVGTCQALALGGPGALFWLWVASFFGMIIKCFEVTLALLYRKKDKSGQWVGGPMYSILHGLGPKWKGLATLYALFALFSSFGMGDLAQANSVGAGILRGVEAFVPLGARARVYLSVAVALLLTVSLAGAIFGGAQRVGKVASFLVPLMSLLFVLLCLGVILFHRENIAGTLSLVVQSAFSTRSLIGGGVGLGAKKALEWGLKRSAFSNEAGLGSAAIAHASAQVDHPVQQGLMGIFEVTVDTLVICSLTGFAVLTALPASDIFSPHTDPSSLITRAFATLYGPRPAALFIGLSLALFAFSTLLGWSLYGQQCATFLFGSAARGPYLTVFVLLAGLGTVLSMAPVWALSDLFNALMAIPNFISLFALAPKVPPQIKDYFAKKKRGENI